MPSVNTSGTEGNGGRDGLSLIVPTAAHEPLKVPYKYGPVSVRRPTSLERVWACVCVTIARSTCGYTHVCMYGVGENAGAKMSKRISAG